MTRAPVLKPPAEWQPIETAPKDGSRVLLRMADGLIGFGRWDDDRYATRSRPFWTNEHLYAKTTQRGRQPQWWLPPDALPDPPSADAPSDYLNQPTRSREAAALDVAETALRQVKIKMLRIVDGGIGAFDEAEALVDKALADIAAILPEMERGRC